MTDSLLIGKVIYDKLSSALTNLDNKIFPIVAENGTNYPFIIYKRTSVQVYSNNKDGYQEDRVTYTVTTVSDKYNESVEIANDVRGVLEHKRILSDDLTLYDNKLVGAVERFSDNAYIQELSFECIVNNNN